MSTRPERRPLRAAIAVAAVGLAVARLALAGRPPEVLEQERKEESLALDYLVRKSDSLASSLVDRRAHLRRRLRAMYKMSQGGFLRLLLGADNATDLFARRNAAERILHRDIAELAAIAEELAELKGLRERLRESEQRSATLLVEAREAQRAGVGDRVHFRRPLPGRIVRPFGTYRDPRGLEFSRDGVDLECRPGEPVAAVAAGGVRSVGELPGTGLAVVIDHPDGWVSVIAGLADAKVRTGARVPAGFILGQAAGPTVHLQLLQAGTWVNPAPFLDRGGSLPGTPAAPSDGPRSSSLPPPRENRAPGPRPPALRTEHR